MGAKALIIVDVQIMPFIWKDFGGKEIYKSKCLLANLNQLIEKAHRTQTPVIFIQYTEGEGSPRAKGQPWWEIHPSIKPEESDIRIIKYHADSFLGTDLQEQLQKLAVKTLVITGVQTEILCGYHVPHSGQ